MENIIIVCLMDWSSNPNYEELLKKVPNIIINALKDIVTEHNLYVTDITFDSMSLGSCGVGDAEIGGVTTAVDTSVPTKIYLTCESELTQMKKLITCANKVVPDKVYKKTELYMFDDYCEPIYTL